MNKKVTADNIYKPFIRVKLVNNKRIIKAVKLNKNSLHLQTFLFNKLNCEYIIFYKRKSVK